MTTIVASKSIGGIAADTRVTTGGAYYPARKLFRVGDSILGTAGHGDACLAFVEWFKNPKRKPSELHEILGGSQNVHMRDEIEILELAPDGIFHWTGWGYREQVIADNYAIGSGGMPALAALRAGKSLEDAVQAAIGIDEYTGCEVQSEYLLPKELTRKKRGR